MSRIIIHVGPHKTGSTYVQKQLRAHESELAEHGISYPDLKSPLFGHGALVRRLRGWGDPVTLSEVRDLTASETVILSSENFVFLSEAQLNDFRSMFQGHDFTVVFVLRSLAKVFPSHWQETVKHGNIDTYLEYLGQMNGWIAGDFSHVIPRIQLNKLASVFGRDSIRIISYEDSDDLFRTFCETALESEIPMLAGDRARVNSSFAAERTELVRRLNTMFRDAHGRTPGQHLRVSYMKVWGKFEKSEEFAMLASEFAQESTVVRLSDTDPLIQREASQVEEAYGDRILNRRRSGTGDTRDSLQVSETPCMASNAPFSKLTSEGISRLYRQLEPKALELLG